MFKSTGSWLIAIGTILLGGSQYFSFGQKTFQSELTLNSYAKEVVSEIENVDFRLDTERVKKDMMKVTNRFLKKRKLK